MPQSHTSTPVLLVQGAQSGQKVLAGIGAATAASGLCVCSAYTAISVCASVGILSDHFHLNPASLPNLDQCQHRYIGTHTAETGALQPHILWGKEIPTQNLIGNRVLP